MFERGLPLGIACSRWKSREELLIGYLNKLPLQELRYRRPSHYWVCAGQKIWMQSSRKANFDPNQPRWPAGSGINSGRWSSSGGRVQNEAQTGISTIDNTTDDLLETLKNVVDFLPNGAGAFYGIVVHTMFGGLVRFGNFPGIGSGDVETTFGGTGVYGAKDSVRTDVILRNEIGDPIAIYDVKTGGATLSAGRVKELREKVGVGSDVPIIQLRVSDGVTIKGRAAASNSVLAHRRHMRVGEEL